MLFVLSVFKSCLQGDAKSKLWYIATWQTRAPLSSPAQRGAPSLMTDMVVKIGACVNPAEKYQKSLIFFLSKHENTQMNVLICSSCNTMDHLAPYFGNHSHEKWVTHGQTSQRGGHWNNHYLTEMKSTWDCKCHSITSFRDDHTFIITT